MIKIRLKPMGKIGKTFYRIVVADEKKKRDGKVVDTLGFYDPQKQPVQLKFDKVKIEKWISQGAVPTEVVRKLLNL